AASAMGQLRNAIRVYATEGHGPAALVTRLNRLTAALGVEPMGTLVLGSLDVGAGRLVYTSAGHLPPIVRRKGGAGGTGGDGGEVQWLDGAASVPVGAVDDVEYPEATVELAPGDTVILYTDGL